MIGLLGEGTGEWVAIVATLLTLPIWLEELRLLWSTRQRGRRRRASV